MQRLRVTFSRNEEIKFISHLDLMRLWERILRRAGLPLAYSEGFNPRPHFSLAAPLSLGTTGDEEMMDIFLSRWISVYSCIQQITPQLPPGLSISGAQLAGLNEPSLQSSVRQAEYEVTIESPKKREEVVEIIRSLLAVGELPWQHTRDNSIRHYDLRPLINDIWIIKVQEKVYTLGMRLRCGQMGTGRPEQVTRALGFEEHPRSIKRVRLILAG